MSPEIAARLSTMGIRLGIYREPKSSYRPTVRTGDLLYFSGQLSAMEYEDGLVGITGQLGRDIDVERGYAAARHCGIGLLARAQAAIGDLGLIRRVVRLTGYVNSAPGFGDQHLVVNGCSDVLIGALGEPGEHTRLAIGVPGLSFNTSVEIDCLIEVAR